MSVTVVEVVDVDVPVVDVVDLVELEVFDVIAGPPGPPGPAGSGAVIVEQPIAIASWTIAHDLGRIPAVQFVIDGQPTDTRCTVTTTHVYAEWPFPVAGTAILI